MFLDQFELKVNSSDETVYKALQNESWGSKTIFTCRQFFTKDISVRPVPIYRIEYKWYLAYKLCQNSCSSIVKVAWQTSEDIVFNFMWVISGHLDHPAKGQAVIFLTGWLAVFISEISILATVSDTSVRYQAVNIQSFSDNMIQWDFLTSCNKILKNHIFRQTWGGLSLAQ